jgi:hypothetical protein
MNLHFIQYLWAFQNFNNRNKLTLDNGNEFYVVYPGSLDQTGNYYLNVKVQQMDTFWEGNILLNLRISDWVNNKKGQTLDNVLFHVVWQNDMPHHDTKLPVFSLKNWVEPNTLENFQHVLNLEYLASWSAFNESAIPDDIKRNYTDNTRKKVPAIRTKKYDTEKKIIDYLHELLNSCKEDVPIIKGKVRTLTIIAWLRETVTFQTMFNGYCKRTPKLSLLGDWMKKAGFECKEKVNVIPLNRILIIIPENNSLL